MFSARGERGSACMRRLLLTVSLVNIPVSAFEQPLIWMAGQHYVNVFLSHFSFWCFRAHMSADCPTSLLIQSRRVRVFLLQGNDAVNVPVLDICYRSFTRSLLHVRIGYKAQK
jgi:hypothetical protein